MYGIRLAGRAEAQSTGMATALTVLYDPTPGSRAVNASSEWVTVTASTTGVPGPGNPYTATVEGNLNGWFVRREETTTAADVVDAKSRWVSVRVEVWTSDIGEHITTIKGRFVRRWP
jgi:hypothetical protein